jgi:hypothetical protein
MRTSLLGSSSWILVTCVTALACGGGQAPTDGAKAPEPAGPPAASAAASPGASPASDGTSTTTSVTLADAGDLQGAKLTESHTVASTAPSASAGNTPPSNGPHAHDAGRGPADIRAIVMARRDEARACYDKGLAAHPGIEGDLVIQWTIDPKGNVTQVSADSARSQIHEPGVVACVGEVIRKIQFAASPGGFETKAFYPFNFHPRGPQPASKGSTP